MRLAVGAELHPDQQPPAADVGDRVGVGESLRQPLPKLSALACTSAKPRERSKATAAWSERVRAGGRPRG
ncbi:MAG: hypothetical protein ABI047_13025 [Jatrophihabitantaceae bacterium]